MIRCYLDWLIELPWSTLSEERIDIAGSARVLDKDHCDLPKIDDASSDSWRCATDP